MAGRQRLMVPRKRRDWTAAIAATQAFSTGVTNGDILLTLESGEVEVTVTRIVGTIAFEPVNFADIGFVGVGIAVVPTVGSVVINPSPLDVGDMANSYWLWTRYMFSSGSTTTTQSFNRGPNGGLWDVDIKVMRKLKQGEALVLQSANGLTNGHEIASQLRILLLK